MFDSLNFAVLTAANLSCLNLRTMYSCTFDLVDSIAYAILCARSNVQEYVIQRFKKQRFADTRKAKLRLSNIKLEELTQILRGKSKQIKH